MDYTRLRRYEIRALRKGFVEQIKKSADDSSVDKVLENAKRWAELQNDCPHDALEERKEDGGMLFRQCSDCGKRLGL